VRTQRIARRVLQQRRAAGRRGAGPGGCQRRPRLGMARRSRAWASSWRCGGFGSKAESEKKDVLQASARHQSCDGVLPVSRRGRSPPARGRGAGWLRLPARPEPVVKAQWPGPPAAPQPCARPCAGHWERWEGAARDCAPPSPQLLPRDTAQRWGRSGVAGCCAAERSRASVRALAALVEDPGGLGCVSGPVTSRGQDTPELGGLGRAPVRSGGPSVPATGSAVPIAGHQRASPLTLFFSFLGWI